MEIFDETPWLVWNHVGHLPAGAAGSGKRGVVVLSSFARQMVLLLSRPSTSGDDAHAEIDFDDPWPAARSYHGP